MNYKSFSLGDWIGHISGVIEDETTLDGNEMRDLVEFLSTLKQEAVSRNDIYFKLTNGAYLNETTEQFIDRLIKELKAMPSVTPTKCIATVKFSKEDMRELIDEKMKDIVVERKKGKWIFTKTIFDKHGCTVECPSCHKKWKTYDEIRWKKENKFCPNCGCFMSERGKE